MRYLPAILLIALLWLGTPPSWASERDSGYLDIPTPSYFYPDTNFTLMSHGFPTSPRDQVLVNGHLYVAMGAYVIIYEVLPNGMLEESSVIMTDHEVYFLTHDGDYLYLFGVNGLQIYDGTDYVHPQLIGSNSLGFSQLIANIYIFGDSLYYTWDDSAWGGPWFGIIDVHDRTEPQVATEFENFIIPMENFRPCAYNRYIIIFTYEGSNNPRFGVYNLDSPPDTLELLDVIYPSDSGFKNIKIYENRLYFCSRNYLQIYEFTSGPQPELRSMVPMPEIPFDMAEVMINNDRYAFVTSWNAHVYKININNLNSPVLVDSIIIPENLNHDFRDIEQYGDYTYAMTTSRNYYVEHPGIHVIDWTLPGGPELVQTARKYSNCNTVKVMGDIAYAATDNDGIIVVDLSNKTEPRVVDLGYVLPGSDVKGDSNMIYAQYGNAIKFYDLTNPLAPVLDWTCPIPLSNGFYLYSYEVYDNFLFANYFLISPNGPSGLIILDISDIQNVQVLFDDINYDHIQQLKLDYPILYYPSNPPYEGRVDVYDISDPANPDHIQTLINSTGSVFQVSVFGDYVYLIGGTNKIYHWNQTGHIAFDRYMNFAPTYIVSDGRRIFYHGVQEGMTGVGIHVWDAWLDPVYPIYSGYHYDNSIGPRRFMDVEWPYVYVCGGPKGLVVLRYDPPTGIVQEDNNLPNKHEISITNFPNPFNSSTSIKYFIPKPVHVLIDIYDLLGRKVKTLVEEDKPAGVFTVIFQSSDLSSGVYFSRIQAGDQIQTRQMVLLK